MSLPLCRFPVVPFRDVVVNGWKDIGIRNDVNGVRKTVNHIRKRHSYAVTQLHSVIRFFQCVGMVGEGNIFIIYIIFINII